jgi:hypothetical protein
MRRIPARVVNLAECDGQVVLGSEQRGEAGQADLVEQLRVPATSAGDDVPSKDADFDVAPT